MSSVSSIMLPVGVSVFEVVLVPGVEGVGRLLLSEGRLTDCLTEFPL